jgi:hypothetical protein
MNKLALKIERVLVILVESDFSWTLNQLYWKVYRVPYTYLSISFNMDNS